MPRAFLPLAGILTLLLAGCGEAPPPPQPEIRPVRVTTAVKGGNGEVVTLTGTVQAQTEVNLSFRISGRIVERLVNVGGTVRAGQVVARIDPEPERNALRAAHAALVAAGGQLVEAGNNYQRQQQLLRDGWTTRVQYDQATQAFQTATSAVDAAQAQFNIAEDRLAWTELVADAPGRVTARRAETGEVVQPGQTVVQLARDGGEDAVFQVPPAIKDRAPANPEIAIALTLDPRVAATGRVREVAPRADAATGTFEVRVGLIDPPEAMRLGSTVTGRIVLGGTEGVTLPASALTRDSGQPAVWLVDTATQTVSLRRVELARFDPARIVVSGGIQPGDTVVTAGVQSLRPGQKVRLLGSQP